VAGKPTAPRSELDIAIWSMLAPFFRAGRSFLSRAA
jgi:hypothetical protein